MENFKTKKKTFNMETKYRTWSENINLKWNSKVKNKTSMKIWNYRRYECASQ